ncbi:MAG: hypothetical protein JWM08_1093 [Candidatus Angelobacter sp.]|nr:hypothetical protein [Candidatus Angelobacter sp.]
MELSTPGKRGFMEGRFYDAVKSLLAIAVTIVVCLTIAEHWKTYDWIKRLLAVGLVSNLAIFPLSMITKLSRGEKAKPDMLFQTAYIWLLPAIMLFSARVRKFSFCKPKSQAPVKITKK